MPSQLLPTFPTTIDESFSRLDVSADFHLDESEFQQFRAIVPLQVDAVHASIRRTVSIAKKTFEFYGLIGVHDLRSQVSQLEELRRVDADTTGMSLHYRLQLRSRRAVSERDDDNWDGLATIAKRLMPPHTARVEYRIGFEAGLAVSAVKLPIVLGPEVRGFSRIGGVRLVEVDSTVPEQELYSVIIDLHGSRLNVDVSTRVEVRFDESLIQDALIRAANIANLGVEKVSKE